jgi:2-polyprenyl-3-methyl-5-hydroxy-6-metoxy-1,4-benzoquinol methylase
VSSGGFDDEPLRGFIDADPWGESPVPYLRGRRWNLVDCADCGTRFHRTVLNPEWNERRFSQWMSQEAIEAFQREHSNADSIFRKAATNTAHTLRIEALTRSLRGRAPVKVLDFGSGYGDFLAVCTSFGFQAFGIDRSQARRDNSVVKVFAEIEDVAPSGPFHALTLFEVLEHLDDPLDLMKKLAKLLMPGGVLILETPNCEGVDGIATMRDYRLIHPLEHINAFTHKTMLEFGRRLGFTAITPPTATVACGQVKIAKSAAKGLLAPYRKPTTQLYFRKD